MSETKRFPLRVLLTVTTDRLLTEPTPCPHSPSGFDNGIGDLYQLLGWLTDDSPFTHQLGRFSKECKPHLFRWFPELGTANACLGKLGRWLKSDRTPMKQESIQMWITEIKMLDPRIKDHYDVPRIPKDDHRPMNPIEELVAMRGTNEGVIVVGVPDAI